jgi:Bacterial PH domain
LTGRTLLAAKLLLVVPWVVFTILALTGVVSIWFVAVSVVSLIPLLLLFSRWETADVARRPVVPVVGSAPQPGEVFRFSSWYSRLLAAAYPAVFGAAGAALLFWNPHLWLLGIPGAIGLGWLVWRCLRVALELSWEEVVVRNPVRTHRLRWADVTHVYLGGNRCIAFVHREHALGIDSTATRGPRLRPELVHALRRYAEPHGVEFDDELLRM